MTDREPVDLEEVRRRITLCLDLDPEASTIQVVLDAIRLADEVEFLREHADQLFGKYVESCDEIDRLREALDTIANPTFPQRAWEYREIARDARRGK